MIRAHLLILIISFCTILSGVQGYKTIFLMEFENVNADFTLNNLRGAFPDLIKANYAFREDIRVEYVSDIEPYQKDILSHQQSDALIINGRFFSDGYRLDVEYELYDIKSWDLLDKKSFYCTINDMICLHDAFLISIEEVVTPYLLDNSLSIIDDQLMALDNAVKNEINSKIIVDNNDVVAQEEFEINLPDLNENISLEYQTYTREFDLSGQPQPVIDPVDQNTEELNQLLSNFLSNPYEVNIGEMEIDFNAFDRDLIDVLIPIEYSVNASLVRELLIDIPHEKVSNENHSINITFSNQNFRFEHELLEKLAYMKYQVSPIIQFTNRTAELQLLIVDSWKGKISDNYDILFLDEFIPMFAIKSGFSNILINIEPSSQVINYKFSVPYNTFGKYTRLSIKFMTEHELTDFLSVTFSNTP